MLIRKNNIIKIIFLNLFIMNKLFENTYIGQDSDFKYCPDWIIKINLVIPRHNYFFAKSNPRVNRMVFASGLVLPEADTR